MASPPLGNSDHVVVSVSIDFPLNSKRDALVHHTAYDCSCPCWDGLRDRLGEVSWEDIFKLGASAATSVFVSVSIDFPSNSNRDALFHCIAYDFSCADWDGLHDHLRDVP